MVLKLFQDFLYCLTLLLVGRIVERKYQPVEVVYVNLFGRVEVVLRLRHPDPESQESRAICTL